MLKFFRRIRSRLVSDNKFSKYLLYAAGEIVLIVLGILIALQISNWNSHRQNRMQENIYLHDIKLNLQLDKENAEGWIDFNTNKIRIIDSLLQLLNQAKSGNDYMSFLIANQRTLGSFPTFQPIRTTFDNMVSSHSLDLIQNKDLRVRLSTYYNYDWEKSPQSVVRSRTRDFASLLTTKLIGEPLYHRRFEEVFKPMLIDDIQFNWVNDFEMNFQNPDYLEFHNDRNAISSMFTMVPTSIYQNSWLNGAVDNIDSLLVMIDAEISNK